MPPKDMPLTVVAMLQETIKEAWASYSGVPENAEQFWNHLVGNGVADVPRETSSPANAHEALIALMQKEVQPSREEWAAHMEEIRRRAGVDVPRETSRFQVDAIYRVNGGALRSTQRMVEAEDWFDARDQVEDGLRAAMPNDELTFMNFSGGAVPDGGPVVADVPRETSQGES